MRADGGAIPERPMLHGQLIYLRPWEREDLPMRRQWVDDAELANYLDFAVPVGEAANEAWFERIREEQGRSHFRYVICRLDDGRAVGSAWLDDVDRYRGAAELGIYVAPQDARSRGLGTDALAVLADLAFGQLRLERLWLRVFTWNTRAIRAYEKAGFIHEGVLRHWTWFRGAWQDVAVMSMLHGEWAARPRSRAWDEA